MFHGIFKCLQQYFENDCLRIIELTFFTERENLGRFRTSNLSRNLRFFQIVFVKKLCQETKSEETF